ncbi:MAG: PAS domain S-box protein [Hyphomicrobiales bacterium]
MSDRAAGTDFADHLLEALFDTAPVGAQIFGPDGTCLQMNRAQAALLGVPDPHYSVGRLNALADPFFERIGLTQYFERAYEGEVVEFLKLVDFGVPENTWETRRDKAWLESVLCPIPRPSGGVLMVVLFARDVSERKRTEERLRRQEQELRELVENAPDAIVRFDRDLTFVYANPELAHVTGRQLNEFIGARLDNVQLNPDTSTVIRYAVQRVFQTSSAFRTDMEIGLGERRRWVEARFAPEFDEQGRVEYVLLIARDISDRRQAETALRASEEQYRATLELLDDIVFRTDASGIIQFVSPSIHRVTGYTRSTLEGKLPREFLLSPGDMDRLRALLLTDGRCNDFETTLRRGNGEPLPVSLNAVVQYDENGNIAGFAGSLRDISQRKRAEAELDRIFNLSTDMLAILDKDARFIRCNPAWETATGYTIDQLLGKRPMDFVHKDDLEQAWAVHQRIAEGTPANDFRARWGCADGSYRWFSWNISVPAEEFRTYCVVRDITGIVEAQQAQDELMEALRSNTQVLEEQAATLDRLWSEAEYTANHDMLTGALNRRAWFALGTSGPDWTVAIFDIDWFKKVNDGYGHPAGDAVLVEVTRRLEAEFAAVEGVVGRLGGEEFGVLLPAGSLSAARRACERAVQAVSTVPIALPGGQAIPVTVSVGLAPWHPRPDRDEALWRTYEDADRALYEAKAAGRARVVARAA